MVNCFVLPVARSLTHSVLDRGRHSPGNAGKSNVLRRVPDYQFDGRECKGCSATRRVGFLREKNTCQNARYHCEPGLRDCEVSIIDGNGPWVLSVGTNSIVCDCRPRLGPMLHRLVGTGAVYFILAVVESYIRVMHPKNDPSNQLFIASIPLALLDSIICWWIFTALIQTTRTLRLRRNLVKLNLYRHFTNTLIFAVLASVVFMLYSIKAHRLAICVTVSSLIFTFLQRIKSI